MAATREAGATLAGIGASASLTRLLTRLHLRHAWQSLRLLLARPMVLPSVGLSLLSMPAWQTQPGISPTSPLPPAPLEPALRRQMREELSGLLDHVPSARWVFPALSVVESALARRRATAVDELPEALMKEAERQLYRLGRTGEADVLRILRDRLCLLVGEPAPNDGDDDGAFEPGRTVEVRDISLTQFMAVDEAG